jgi:hypothetical protein
MGRAKKTDTDESFSPCAAKIGDSKPTRFVLRVKLHFRVSFRLKKCNLGSFHHICKEKSARKGG